MSKSTGFIVPHHIYVVGLWRGNTNKQWSHYQHETSLVHTNLHDAETILVSCSRVPHLPSARPQILFEASWNPDLLHCRLDAPGGFHQRRRIF